MLSSLRGKLGTQGERGILTKMSYRVNTTKQAERVNKQCGTTGRLRE